MDDVDEIEESLENLDINEWSWRRQTQTQTHRYQFLVLENWSADTSWTLNQIVQSSGSITKCGRMVDPICLL